MMVGENCKECEKVIELANKNEKYIHILIRINPEISAHTHKYILTGDSDSKFGVLLHKEDTILKMIKMTQDSTYVNFDGFHCHIGSQIFDIRAYEIVIERLMRLIKKLESQHSIEIENLNLGGGFGVRYTDEDYPKTVKEVCNTIIKKCEDELISRDLKLRKIMIEPGRSIVAEAGYTLYTVGFMKETPNKSYVFVDGGMTDNMRVALYEAKYECDLANKIDNEKLKKYSVAGKCCESGDILIEGAILPIAEQNDLLVFYGTGAYGYSMANNYNRMRKPAVVFIKDGKVRIVIERESYESLMGFETNVEVKL